MEELKFQNTLITGNTVIDSQHHELIKMINQLLLSCRDTDKPENAEKMLEYMNEYCQYHFYVEEKLQQQMKYPGLKEHERQHNLLTAEVRLMNERLKKEGPSEAFADELTYILTDWFLNHISKYDKELAGYTREYIKETGITPAVDIQ